MTEHDTAALYIRDLTLDYGRNTVVRDVNVAFKPQELGCLLGPSGCGKSTLLRAIAGFQPLSSGEIWLDNHLLASPGVSVAPEHRGVGMVFQDIALFPHLTVDENIRFGLTACVRRPSRRSCSRVTCADWLRCAWCALPTRAFRWTTTACRIGTRDGAQAKFVASR
jgi:ABC-type spermidine/putrescine transport systems, ATPase components